MDEQSQKYLDDWQSEQLSAYSMFEALVNEDVSGSSRSANESDTLVRNKNRVALRSQSLDKFVQRQFGVGPERPVSAADRKLARNKTRAKGFTSSSSSSSSSSGVDGGEGGGNEFELLSPKRAAVVVLSGKPLRPPGAFDQQKVSSIFNIMFLLSFFSLFSFSLLFRRGGLCQNGRRKDCLFLSFFYIISINNLSTTNTTTTNTTTPLVLYPAKTPASLALGRVQPTFVVPLLPAP